MAAALPALALTSAPAAQAACEKWGIPWTGLEFSQTNGWTGAIVFYKPAPADPPLIDSFSGASIVGRFRDNPAERGQATGSVRGDTISFSVVWPSGVKGSYRGTVDQNGIASGTTSGGGQTANWRSNHPLGRCPASAPLPGPQQPAPPPPPQPTKCPPGGPKTEVPAGEKCPPPTNAISVTFPNKDISQWTVRVQNTAGIGGSCTYSATDKSGLLPFVNRGFDIAPNGTASFQVPAPPPLSSWQVVTFCTGTYDGQQVEFGRDVQTVP